MAIRFRLSFLKVTALAVVLIISVSLFTQQNVISPLETSQNEKSTDTPDSFMGGLRNLLNSKPKSELTKEEEEFKDALAELGKEKHDHETDVSVSSLTEIAKTNNGKSISGIQFPANFDGYKAGFELADQYQRQNATILTLCRNEDLQDTIDTVRKLEDRFNRNYHYDWVFLNNEPFSKEFETRVGSLVSGTAKFGVIPKEHWSYPDFIDQDVAAVERDKMHKDGVIYASSEPYRHMCRFNSGFFFLHPLLQDYKYYWRVEPHVEFWCDVKIDPFKVMVDEKKTYGFTISIHEFHRTIETLWPTTVKFIKENPQYLHKNNFMDFISDNDGTDYNLCHFWSNFEIADMDFWRSEAYMEYFNYLDQAGGFFYERWGDAPVHSIAVALFEDKDKIHYFKEIGYTHGPYTMCPIEDSVYDEFNCVCDKNNDFTFEGYSCGKKYYDAMGLKKPSNWKMYS